MTDRPEERRCPCCGGANLRDYEDHVAACRRRRQDRRAKLARRNARKRAKPTRKGR